MIDLGKNEQSHSLVTFKELPRIIAAISQTEDQVILAVLVGLN
jgi:hypothetical protein